LEENNLVLLILVEVTFTILFCKVGLYETQDDEEEDKEEDLEEEEEEEGRTSGRRPDCQESLNVL
jgi:hypothetical protein